jgi:hypothetical protein
MRKEKNQTGKRKVGTAANQLKFRLKLMIKEANRNLP